MRQRKLTKQTFTTKDANGCEFKCTVLKQYENLFDEKPTWQCYYALDLEDNNLKNLKERVANL